MQTDLNVLTEQYIRGEFTAEEVRDKVDFQSFLRIGHLLLDKVEATINRMFATLN